MQAKWASDTDKCLDKWGRQAGKRERENERTTTSTHTCGHEYERESRAKERERENEHVWARAQEREQTENGHECRPKCGHEKEEMCTGVRAHGDNRKKQKWWHQTDLNQGAKQTQTTNQKRVVTNDYHNHLQANGKVREGGETGRRKQEILHLEYITTIATTTKTTTMWQDLP